MMTSSHDGWITVITGLSPKLKEVKIIQTINNNWKEENSFFFCDLKREDIKPTEFIVDRILFTGLTLFCGSSKIGKSWFALELALAVASGEDFLGFKTKKSSVFYYALEDTQRRLLERTLKIQDGKPIPPNLKGSIHCSTLSSSFLGELENELNKDKNIRLVIIDTLQKIRGKSNNGEQAYAYDYREMSMLKRFADEKNICLLVIHHTRKEADIDKYNMINGTNGLMGVADTTMILSKENRTDSNAVLSIIGRDIEEQEYSIDFDVDKCIWKMKATVEETNKQKLLEQFHQSFLMFRILSMPRPFSITSSELSEALEKENGIEMKPYAVGSEIRNYEEILLEEFGIRHTFKRTSDKRIHTFEDI